MSRHKKVFFDEREIKKNSLSVQRSVVESFKFNDKNIRAFYIKDVGQCFISQAVYTAVGSDKENRVKAMQRLVPGKYKMRLGDVMIGMKGLGIRLQPNMVLLTGHGLKLFLMRCHKPKAFDVAKHFDIKIEHCLPASKEQDALGQIMQAFNGEEMIYQFGTGKYRIDLYFPKYKLVIECDEFDHHDRDIKYEAERQKNIEKLLDCTFVRFNPDAKDFCILKAVNKVFIHIKSSFQM